MNDKAGFRLISDIVPHFAARQPEKVAIRFEGQSTTWSELLAASCRIGHALRAQGLKPGDRVGYIGKNSDDWLKLFFGASMAGIVFVPINWRLALPEMSYIIEHSGCRLVFVAGEEFTEGTQEIAEAVDSVMACIGLADYKMGWPVLMDWYGGQSTDPLPPATDRSDLILLVYTSGTTGQPKAAMMAHNNFLSMRERLEGNTRDDVFLPDDVALMSFPMGHITCAYPLKTLYAGGTCILTRELRPDELLKLIEVEGVTRLAIVPTAIQILLDNPRVNAIDYSRLRLMEYGAAPISFELLRRAIAAFGCEFSSGYGMTETFATVAALPAEDHDANGNERMRSAGKALPGVEIKIVDPAMNELPRGTTGEVVVRSVSTMLGYWGKPKITAETLTADRWLHTGDAAYMDQDGYIYLQDRIKDMIISGGENIYSAEVERAISSHPDVIEVAVIGVPDAKWGERVKAFVVLRDGTDVAETHIISWARSCIAPFKAPKEVEFATALPRNATGKIWKLKLREMSVLREASVEQ